MGLSRIRSAGILRDMSADEGARQPGRRVGIKDVAAGKIAAIKWYREQTGKDLKSSKDFVEELMRRHNVSAPKSGCAGIVLVIVATSAAVAALAGA